MFSDVLICLRFFSRLPVPTTRREIALGAGGLTAAAAMVPVAGLVIGLFPAAALLAATAAGLAPFVAATLTVAVAVIICGGLHEDALVDCADGFFGGTTQTRRLDIMRDSRIGAYGACAIGLSLMLRISTIASLSTRSPALAATVLIATAGLSRALSLLPIALLPPARPDGNGASFAPSRARVAGAILLGLLFVLLPYGFGAPLGRAARAIILAGVGALGMVLLARRMIGGQTGDVAGATQQIAELVMLVVFSASP